MYFAKPRGRGTAKQRVVGALRAREPTKRRTASGVRRRGGRQEREGVLPSAVCLARRGWKLSCVPGGDGLMYSATPERVALIPGGRSRRLRSATCQCSAMHLAPRRLALHAKQSQRRFMIWGHMVIVLRLILPADSADPPAPAAKAIFHPIVVKRARRRPSRCNGDVPSETGRPHPSHFCPCRARTCTGSSTHRLGAW